MNGNSQFNVDSSQSLLYFLMLLAVAAVTYGAFKKNTALGILTASGAGLGLFYFFTNPTAGKYITAAFAVFLLIGMAQWGWEKMKY